MSAEKDLEIATSYKEMGGTGRLVEEDGSIKRDPALDPPEAEDHWKRFIEPRISAGDHLGIFQHLK